MRRREFLGACVALAAACGELSAKQSSTTAPASARRIALTMDDPNTQPTPLWDWQERNRRILKQLAERQVQLMLFVCGKRVDSPEGTALLTDFERAGHLLANHSYSHLNYNTPELTSQELIADVQHCEALCGRFASFRRRFRFPYLKEGDTAEKRDAIRDFMKAQKYTNGHVTIDTSDWAYDMRLKARLEEDPKLDKSSFRTAYLAHMLDRVHYYESLAMQVLGHSIPHTLLMHHNLISTLFIGDLVDALRGDGFTVISPEEAYADPVFALQPANIPAGESLIWAMAQAAPNLKTQLRYPGEDETYEAAALEKL